MSRWQGFHTPPFWHGTCGSCLAEPLARQRVRGPSPEFHDTRSPPLKQIKFREFSQPLPLRFSSRPWLSSRPRAALRNICSSPVLMDMPFRFMRPVSVISGKIRTLTVPLARKTCLKGVVADGRHTPLVFRSPKLPTAPGRLSPSRCIRQYFLADCAGLASLVGLQSAIPEILLV